MPNQTKFLIDFLPAELHEANSGWFISYYVAHPATGKLTRKRIKWNRITNITERRKTGKQLCQKINLQLAQGWNPYIEQEAPRSYATLTEATTIYLNQIKKQIKDGSMRPDTLRSYTSYINIITNWWAANKKHEPHTHFFTQNNVRQFLDYIYYDQDNSPRTHNNYISFISTLGSWLVANGYCKANPATGLPKKRVGDKTRTIIAPNYLAEIFTATQPAPGWHALLKTIYYTFVRRTELTFLQVQHINLAKQILTIPAAISKNRTENSVVLPNTLVDLLAPLIAGQPKTYFLFSANDFLPGPERILPKKISDQWARLRKQLALPSTYQFYSLKDTGITAMLTANVAPIIVRDQARHHDIAMTNKYTPSGANLGSEILREMW